MLKIDQILLLEKRVQTVIEHLRILREENAALKEKIAHYEGNIEELESRIASFADNQSAIEEGILKTLHQLDGIEDMITSTPMESRMVEQAGQAEPLPEQQKAETPQKTQENAAASNTQEEPEGTDQAPNSNLDIF